MVSHNPKHHSSVATTFRLFLLSITLLVYLGCGSSEKLEIREESYPEIKIGMTRSKLETMLGAGEEMRRAAALQLFGELEKERFEIPDNEKHAPKALEWKSKDFSLMVLLVDDEVVAKAETGNLKQAIEILEIRK